MVVNRNVCCLYRACRAQLLNFWSKAMLLERTYVRAQHLYYDRWVPFLLLIKVLDCSTTREPLPVLRLNQDM